MQYIKTDDNKRQFLLADDLAQLEQDVAAIGDVGLITIDPITAYMGGKMDSHKATEVRAQLGPLKDFAERTNVAVSTITHPAKNAGSKSIDHFIGSQAFVAAGRIGHVCVEETKENEDGENLPTGRILFANAKNNPHEKMPTLAYRIVGIIIGRDESTGDNIETPHVTWEKEAVNITADEAIASARGRDNRKSRDAHREAEEFLSGLLQNGPVEQKVVEEKAKQRGFSPKHLRRARKTRHHTREGRVQRRLAVAATGRRGPWLIAQRRRPKVPSAPTVYTMGTLGTLAFCPKAQGHLR